LFADWIRMMPLLAEHIKVEAGFGSFSTLLILSLTVPLWCYLQDHPAISMTGMIRTSNLVTQLSISPRQLCPDCVQSDSDPMPTTKPTPRTLKWGLHREALIQLYKFCFNKDEPYFELLPEIKSTASIPRRLYLDTPAYVLAASA
jgi:hypothetical protein